MLISPPIAILFIQDDPFINKLRRDLYSGIQVPTWIIAQVDNNATRVLLEQIIQSGAQFLRCLFSKGIDIDISDTILEHFSFGAAELDLSARDGEFQGLRLTLACHR